MWLKKSSRPPFKFFVKKCRSRRQKAAETRAFIKSVELVHREALMIERGAHGGGCPYPSRMFRRHWYNGFFDWL